MSAYPYTYPASPFRSAPGSPNVASGSSSSYTYNNTYTSDRDPSSSTSATAAAGGVQPTTRSRTLLFISYRDSIARSAPSRSRRRDYAQHEHEHGDTDTLLFSADDEQQRLIGEEGHGHGHVSVDMDAQLPPRWVDASDQVHDILAGTQSKISVLEKLHAKHVLPGFADRSSEEREIDALTTDITRDFRRCQSLIQSISASSNGSFPPTKPTKHEQLAAQNVQRGLAAKVQELSATFRKKQRVYMETLQGHAIKNQDLLIASGAVTLKGAEGMSDLDEDMQIAAHGERQASTLLLRQEEELAPAVDLQQRDREITEIARSIAQLAELFKDLSALVIDQGTLLDSVEYNIEQTAVEMQEAVTELKIAEGYQRNTGRRKCILLLLLIIFGLIVVLIFKPRRHANGTGSTTAPISAVSTAPSQDTASSDPDASQLPPLPILSIDLGSGFGGTGSKLRSAVNSYARKRDGRADSVRDGEFAERIFDSFPISPTLMVGDRANTRRRRPLEHLRMYYPVV